MMTDNELALAARLCRQQAEALRAGGNPYTDQTKLAERAASKLDAMRPRFPVVELLRELPPDERIRHWRRLDAQGAFDSHAV